MKANISQLLPGNFYHIYNRGINAEIIFKKDTHYQLFLNKYIKHVWPYVDTFAYCLMSNHFHLLVRIKTEEEIINSSLQQYPMKKNEFYDKFISRQFSHLFNGYTQVINNECKRTGGLFESPYRRIEVSNHRYFTQLIGYIHQNPQKHGFVSDFREYHYSSYQSHLFNKATKLKRDEVLSWFGGKEDYLKFHQYQLRIDENLNKLIIEF